MKSRRIALAALAAPFVAPPLRAQQAGFPNRPLRLVVTYPPGGVTDIVGRICAEALGPRLGQPMVVENRAGAGGNIGVQAAAAAEPDGYTLDRKSTRLNSSHANISYAVFCLKKKTPPPLPRFLLF